MEVVSAEPDAAFITPTVAQMAGKAMQTGAYVHKVTHAVMQHMSSSTRRSARRRRHARFPRFRRD